MLLAIDSGNTNTVFSVFDDDGNVKGEWRSSTNANRTADEFAVWLFQLMSYEDVKAEDINDAIIATVVPAMLFNLQQLCRRYFKVEPLVVGDPSVDLGIEIFLNRPEEVGADRLVNAIAAHELYKGPLIVIDFGTATTFDVVDENGNPVKAGNFGITVTGEIGGEGVQLPTAVHRHIGSVSLAGSGQGIILNLDGNVSISLDDVIQIGS